MKAQQMSADTLARTSTGSAGTRFRVKAAALVAAFGLLASLSLVAPSQASAHESVEDLDPQGTSEESGSGEIIIYRDRNGEIEGTSETHGVMAGPDGKGDYRRPGLGR